LFKVRFNKEIIKIHLDVSRDGFLYFDENQHPLRREAHVKNIQHPTKPCEIGPITFNLKTTIMKKYLLLIPLLVFLFATCKNEKQAEQESDQTQLPEGESPHNLGQRPKKTKLTVNIDNIRLRSTAGEDGDEIARLSKGTEVYDMGEISDFTTKVKLRGIQFDEPWIKVKTDKGVEGWLYAGGLQFDMDNTTQLSETLLAKRLQNMFGKDLARQIKIYRTNYHSAKTSAEFASAYRQGLTVRDSMVSLMETDISIVDDDKLADLNWLEQTMPGYIVQLAKEGTMYYLFNDYSRFKNKAVTTTGSEDDAMAELLFASFAVDSIEHFFPAWFLQTWDYGGASLLGQGIHLDLLDKMEGINKSKLFQKETNDLRDRLINDISGQHVEYWEPQQRILDELDRILDQDFQQLTKEDVITLETRRKLFEDPKANKIKVNLRSGQ